MAALFFAIGDGAGVGKGRTVAGIIYQNYLEGRKKAVWLVTISQGCCATNYNLFLIKAKRV